MAYFVGRRGSLGAAKEGTRGQATTPALWVPYNSVSFDDKAVVVDSEGAFGQIADSYEAYIVKKFAEGDIEFDLDDKFIGLIESPNCKRRWETEPWEERHRQARRVRQAIPTPTLWQTLTSISRFRFWFKTRMLLRCSGWR